MSYILDVLDLVPGEITTIDTEHRSIHYLISKEKYNIPTSYINIFDNLYNLKKFAIKEKYEHIALCVENLTNNELKWEIIKNMIFEIFNETEIHLLLCHTPTIFNNKKTNIISHIKNTHNTIANTNNCIKNNYSQFNKIFSKYQIGENVKSDGNCGLYALTNAINENKSKKIITLADILNLLELSELPNYWWHDDQLSSIANHFDTYILIQPNTDMYTDQDLDLLYNLNNGTHWCPGTLIKNNGKSNKIPQKIIYTNNYISLE